LNLVQVKVKSKLLKKNQVNSQDQYQETFLIIDSIQMKAKS